MTDGYEQRKNLYVDTTLGPWANKHGITLQQAASIVIRDNLGGVSYRNLFDFVEHQKFCEDVLKDTCGRDAEGDAA